jgi:steroid Delta-isomerase
VPRRDRCPGPPDRLARSPAQPIHPELTGARQPDADVDAASRAYAAYYESLTPESIADLRALVAADIHFRDPFNDVRGVDRMIRVLRKMFEDASDIRFERREQACSGNLCFIRWRFFFRPRRFAGGEIWPVEGVSAVRFDRAGKVVEHIDYWDAASQIYGRLPLLGRLLRLIQYRLGTRD